ncbi:MAG: TonB family protein [Gammaproteobacteria bacterium]|nr:TonB family protein [Gammaproteobacteria bacterium]
MKNEGPLNDGIRGTDDRHRKSNEFDDAVTSEIPEALSRFFDDDEAADQLHDVIATNIELSTRIDLDDDFFLESGLHLNDRYEIIELINTGGMGLIYKAVDRQRIADGADKAYVAIKILRQSLAAPEKLRLALEREASRAQSLAHPNIINIFDCAEHEGKFFLVMEWLQGESVNDLLRRTRGLQLAQEFAWPLIAGAATGLQYAHSNNIVHADINPSNIFITDDDEIKLLDFGVARNCGVPEQDETYERFSWVTPTYASPEVLSEETPVFEDDVFSLACVAYRLLKGSHPFGGSPSIVAEKKQLMVEPIPGLAEEDWKFLRQALSYKREDRPKSVSGFLRDRQGTSAVGRSSPWFAREKSPWRLMAVAGAIAAIAGFLWLLKGEPQNELVPPAATQAGEEASAAETADRTTPAEIESLLGNASQAMNEQRLVSPDDASARFFYSQVMGIEPANPTALRGLRAISDEFVRRANEAVRADDLNQAYSAVAIAAETDAANPAIEIVEQIIVAQGDGVLADSRTAVAIADFETAATLLSRAERYRHIDPDAIQSIRQQIARFAQDRQFLDSLASANALIAAGRLTAPADDNAHAALVELHQVHGDDLRLLDSMQRLGERLLTRAAFAAAAGRFTEATELLDAVDTLGVLSPEVISARESMLVAIDGSETQEAPVSVLLEEPGSDLTSPVLAAAAVADVELAITTDSENTSVAAVANLPQASREREPASDTIVAAAAVDESPPRQVQSVEQFGIKRYVAPVFPRSARLRGLSGLVEVRFNINIDGRTDAIDVLRAEPDDVFVSSAVKAVKQWRFEPQEEVFGARITLRFESPP